MFSPYDYYVTPDEYEEAIRQGIPRVRVDERIRKLGWGKREAITKPLRGYKDRSEIMKLAKAHGISYNQFIGRVLIGWDEWRAATIPPSPYNAPNRVKELYGEDYFDKLYKWLFAPARVKWGANKKNP